ncbi:hypothetical protein ROJ8625_00373 [Roseivivax jejudonensis]|uniref:DUF5681 domain-containing protein n=1 Tax=Roseivivax jejudonensis TaxID=1529041 RepID=A0A1X6Y7F1_9RHOB|nr:DUF5681 domain-containing protein [Roseivivax jejudonensis]SLN12883.1 hypothetical protein ROJ8625_00373 [Roseivivax jejudonensis]
MSDEIKSGRKVLATRPGYEVGYGKPPVSTRFKKGQSGNPKGRPKGAKNKRPGLHEERMKDIILDEAYRGITVKDGDRTVTIPMAQAVIRAMAVNAAKGQHRAQRLFAELLASVEGSRKRLHDEYFEKAATYKIEWDKELKRRHELGITNLEDPVPHPDHIKLDMSTGTVRITGPMTPDDKAEIDKWRDQLPRIEAAVAELREQLETEDDPEERATIRYHIRQGEDLWANISSALDKIGK